VRITSLILGLGGTAILSSTRETDLKFAFISLRKYGLNIAEIQVWPKIAPCFSMPKVAVGKFQSLLSRQNKNAVNSPPMKKLGLFLSILLLHSGLASATDSSLEQQLRKTYVGTQRMLRHFYAAADLREGSWTLLSGVLIDSLKLKAEKLELRGHRRILVTDEKTKAFRSIELHENFSIEINTQSGPDQAAQIANALDCVFVSNDDLVSVVPDYWRDYLARSSGKTTQGVPCEDSAAKLVSDDAAGGKVSAGIAEGQKVHDVPPTYFQIARQNRVQGELALRAVIDKTGSVSRVCITQALGAGLDDMMVDTVRQWKYRPYTLNGQPIEVQTTVTTRFGMR
jgi:TonB family protein